MSPATRLESEMPLDLLNDTMSNMSNESQHSNGSVTKKLNQIEQQI